jgi:ubiquinone/menaquinone biosynthesis C-methylase UbiE
VNPVARAFSSVADVYERARPSYPAEAVDHLARALGLRAGATVVDLGAGTGKLTRLLVPTGARVVAVEPLPEMRAVLERVVPGIEAVEGTAEGIPLADGAADAVTAAQAFHWFDPARALPEIHRVLRPGGRLGLIWNSRDLDDPLQARVEELISPYRETHPQQMSRSWQAPLSESPLFGPAEEVSVHWDQTLTREELAERVLSTSAIAALPEDERAPLLDRVRAVIGDRSEPFPFRYRTDVFVFPSIE